MAYTDIDDPSAYFQTTLYTGNGSTNAITNTGNSDLQPDWLWLKKRNSSANHFLFDAVRGASKELNSNNTEAEASPANYLSSFNSDGFTIGSDSDINGSSDTHVAWQWKAGTSFTNDASATGIGSIDSTGSVNQDAGFSIVSFTGNGSTGATVGHGLGVKPDMIILKTRSNSDTSWQLYHKSLGATKYIQLNLSNSATTSNTRWNNVEPTSTVFTLGSSGDVNTNNATIIAYCFASKQGYSKFGSYTGNGNTNGTFIYTGFKPAFMMVKCSSSSGQWFMFDNKRIGYNSENYRLIADVTDSEDDPGQTDFLSNGFKMRFTSGNANGSGKTYIYMAFAENPFVTSSGVPATAK